MMMMLLSSQSRACSRPMVTFSTRKAISLYNYQSSRFLKTIGSPGRRSNSPKPSQPQTHATNAMHGSGTKQHSTTTSMGFTHSAPSMISRAEFEKAPYPSITNLRALFIASAIPMVGFGAMDNIVMIQAGQYIDSTLGVSLGLATMTAAAAGQVVSDVSGVVFGGTLERVLSRMGVIPAPTLTNAQRQLSICKNVSMLGAVVGVILGCALGACTLLLVDLDARNRIERAQQLREIVTDMISDTDIGGLSAETSTIYLVSKGSFDLDNGGSSSKFRTSMEFLDGSQSDSVTECARSHTLMHDKMRNIIYAPVAKGEELIAVVEFRHSRANDSTTFSDDDVEKAKIIAKHVAIFINRIVE